MSTFNDFMRRELSRRRQGRPVSPPRYEEIESDRVPLRREPEFRRLVGERAEGSRILGAVGTRDLELTVRRQSEMARDCCVKILSVTLHGVIVLATGGFGVYSLIGVEADKECLPPLLDHFGDPMKFYNGLPKVCNAVWLAMCAISVLNVLMCIGTHCFVRNCCILSLNFMVVLVMAIATVFSATVFSVHYMLWCDSLMQRYQYGDNKCKSAAMEYGVFHHTSNMTWYHDRLEIQQAGLWAIVPVFLLAILMYSIVLRMNSANNNSEDQRLMGNYRYIILQDESTPLTNPLGSVRSLDERGHHGGRLGSLPGYHSSESYYGYGSRRRAYSPPLGRRHPFNLESPDTIDHTQGSGPTSQAPTAAAQPQPMHQLEEPTATGDASASAPTVDATASAPTVDATASAPTVDDLICLDVPEANPPQYDPIQPESVSGTSGDSNPFDNGQQGPVSATQ